MYYVVIAVLIVLNIIVIFIVMNGAHRVPDDPDMYNEDGDHIYYDRKVIRHKNLSKTKREQMNPNSDAPKTESHKYEDIALKANFLIEYDIELDKEFEEIVTIDIHELESVRDSKEDTVLGIILIVNI